MTWSELGEVTCEGVQDFVGGLQLGERPGDFVPGADVFLQGLDGGESMEPARPHLDLGSKNFVSQIGDLGAVVRSEQMSKIRDSRPIFFFVKPC